LLNIGKIFAAPVGEEIEHRNTLGDARGMVGGELENAVAEPNLFGALAGGGEEGLGSGRVRVFFEEMMLYNPGVVIAEPVGGLELRQRVLVEPELVALLPGARQLQLVEDSEFHDASQRACCFQPVYSSSGPSPASTAREQFRGAEAALHGTREWLALRFR
jgi:hypothetical protein